MKVDRFSVGSLLKAMAKNRGAYLVIISLILHREMAKWIWGVFSVQLGVLLKHVCICVLTENPYECFHHFQWDNRINRAPCGLGHHVSSAVVGLEAVESAD